MSTLVVLCHPVPESFVTAVAAQVVETLDDAGAEPRLLNLYAEEFSPTAAGAAVVEAHGEELRNANALVLVYPTWWSGLPAMLAGWLEQVVAGGSTPRPGRPETTASSRELLANLRYVAAVTTHGSSKYVNAVQGEAGLHFMRHSMHPLCPADCRLVWLAFYGSDISSMADRRAFLARVDRRLRKLA
ncbi:MAG: NAD(P)H-dependent oxidoreductase [bacterium]|nr:NAD(P)H-dependent oxidoreductase [bacterium]